MEKAREFTRDDWAGFAGAEAWGPKGPGSEPLYRDLTNGFAIASMAGLEVFRTTDDDTQSFAWPVTFPTQKLARLVLDALPDDAAIFPEEFGFEAL